MIKRLRLWLGVKLICPYLLDEIEFVREQNATVGIPGQRYWTARYSQLHRILSRQL